MKKILVLTGIFFWIISSLALASNRTLTINLEWTSGSSRTDLDLYVINPDGDICNYASTESNWGATHERDDQGTANSYSYESFTVDLDAMDCFASGNYEFHIKHYSGPTITSTITTSGGQSWPYTTSSGEDKYAVHYSANQSNCETNNNNTVSYIFNSSNSILSADSGFLTIQKEEISNNRYRYTLIIDNNGYLVESPSASIVYLETESFYPLNDEVLLKPITSSSFVRPGNLSSEWEGIRDASKATIGFVPIIGDLAGVGESLSGFFEKWDSLYSYQITPSSTFIQKHKDINSYDQYVIAIANDVRAEGYEHTKFDQVKFTFEITESSSQPYIYVKWKNPNWNDDTTCVEFSKYSGDNRIKNPIIKSTAE